MSRLLAIGMELPEDTFVKQHNIAKPSHTSGIKINLSTAICSDFPLTSTFHEVVSRSTRWELSAMRRQFSYPRDAEEEAKTRNVWLKGHTGKLSDCNAIK